SVSAKAHGTVATPGSRSISTGSLWIISGVAGYGASLRGSPPSLRPIPETQVSTHRWVGAARPGYHAHTTSRRAGTGGRPDFRVPLALPVPMRVQSLSAGGGLTRCGLDP